MKITECLTGYADAGRRLRHEVSIAAHRVKCAERALTAEQAFHERCAAEQAICDKRTGELTLRLLTCGMSARRALQIVRRLKL